MQIMKAKSRIFSVMCASAVLLSGCGKAEEKKNDKELDPNEPATITIWHYYNGVQQENFDNMVVEFNETVGLEQGIVVEARSKGTIAELSDSALASLRKDVGAEPAPDMFAAYAETAYTADEMGCVADLSDYFTAEELAEYVEGYLEEGQFGGSDGLKIFPTAKSTEVMMINLTDWQSFADAEGVTFDSLSTWEGLAEAADKYYDYTDALTPDIPADGKAFFGRDSVANYMIVGAKQLGLEFFSLTDDGFTMNENKAAVRKLWDCYYVPYVKGCYFSQARFRSDDAKIGAIISMVCSTTGAAYFPESVTINDEDTYPIEGIVLPVPNFAGCDPYVVQQGAGMVVVKSDQKKEYACSVFLKWITEKERNIDFSVSSGYLPVKKSANDAEAFSAAFAKAQNSGSKALVDAMQTAASEIDGYKMYAAKPFARSTEARDFLDTFIQNTAQQAHDDAYARIDSGEERGSVLEEYISDAAFEAWYAEFISGLNAAVGS